MVNAPPPFIPGAFVGAEHHFRARVYFEDTDLSGIVYHANYLRWFERARSDLVRMLGIDQRAALEGGEGAYAVADLHIRYARPARLDDTVVTERLTSARFFCEQLMPVADGLVPSITGDSELLMSSI